MGGKGCLKVNPKLLTRMTLGVVAAPNSDEGPGGRTYLGSGEKGTQAPFGLS